MSTLYKKTEFELAMERLWADIHKEIEPKMETLKEALKLRAEKRRQRSEVVDLV